MSIFSRDFFEARCDLQTVEKTVSSAVCLGLQNPTALYLAFQRFIYFNGYTSAVISRLASSIAMSRYLFQDSDIAVIEESDRGFDIAMKVMVAAYDEGSNDAASHRALAQALLKTMGNYAGLSDAERNQFMAIPAWLDDIAESVMEQYQGKPNDVAALVRSLGFHAASELMGDVEYALIDRIFRYDNKNTGFYQYLSKVPPVEISGHRYNPWCYILIHSQYEGDGVEASHFECVADALNMVVKYRPESAEQIMEWALEGFTSFISLEQRLFREITQECQSRFASSLTTQNDAKVLIPA
jgi:hypothetical protein